jgi:dihydroorotase
VFEDAGALDKLEGFASHYGPDFYGLSRNTDSITLRRADERIPEQLDFGGAAGVPLRAGGQVRWTLAAS